MRPARDRVMVSRWLALFVLAAVAQTAEAFPVSSAAWSNAQWEQHCKDVRTSYNPAASLRTDRLTLKPDDERFLDFLYWVWANKIIEHQVEAVGGTEWAGPSNGVIFHWAPGSRWETHTVVSFPHAIHHIADEHHWQDNMFKEFFERVRPDQERQHPGAAVRRLAAAVGPVSPPLFQLYDRYGKGFASKPGWAGQPIPTR